MAEPAPKPHTPLVGDHTVTGSYKAGGEVRVYTLRVHGIAEDEVGRVVAPDKPVPLSGSYTVFPKGPRRLGVGRHGKA